MALVTNNRICHILQVNMRPMCVLRMCVNELDMNTGQSVLTIDIM